MSINQSTTAAQRPVKRIGDASPGGFEAGAFRSILGRYPTGVVIVTGIDGQGAPQGMVVGTFTSVSLEPPLVSFMPSVSSSSWAKMQDINELCINVLAADQEDLCRVFTSKSVSDKWAGVNWRPSPSGAPILEGSVAWISCSVEEVLLRGDHYIVLGRVGNLEAMRSVSPLTFIRGGYGRFTTDSLVSDEVPGLRDQLRVSRMARATMERLARRTGYEVTAQAVHGDELVILAAAGGDDPDWAAAKHIGIRLPFIPPFGGLFMAWASQASIDHWVGHRWVQEEAFRDRILSELRAIRDAGFAIVTPIDPEIDETLDLMFAGGEPDSAALKRIRTRVQDLEPYIITEVKQGSSNEVRYLGAPIFDDQGRVIVGLHLLIGEELGAIQTQDLVNQLVSAAATVTAQIRGRDRKSVPGPNSVEGHS